MANVPRERFIARRCGMPLIQIARLAIPCGQTISQPYIVGLMSEPWSFPVWRRFWRSAPAAAIRRRFLAKLAAEVVSVERPRRSCARGCFSAGELVAELTLVTGDGTLGWPARARTSGSSSRPPPSRCRRRCGTNWPRVAFSVMPLGPPDHQVLRRCEQGVGITVVKDLSLAPFVPLIAPKAGRYGRAYSSRIWGHGVRQ